MRRWLKRWSGGVIRVDGYSLLAIIAAFLSGVGMTCGVIGIISSVEVSRFLREYEKRTEREGNGKDRT